MADAIPVHSKPKKEVAVQASPSVDPDTGKVTEGNYAAKPRENTVSDIEPREPVVIECPAPTPNSSAFIRTDN
jgi:hypothetical protein